MKNKYSEDPFEIMNDSKKYSHEFEKKGQNWKLEKKEKGKIKRSRRVDLTKECW